MSEPASIALTGFQIEVGRLFFTLAESDGFLLAGGAAQAALGLTTRPTADLGIFTPRADGVLPAGRALQSAAESRGWTVVRLREATTFLRLRVDGPESVLVDLAQDSGPIFAPVMSLIGPTHAAEELGGRKLVALFNRAAARDFVDVFLLAHRFGTKALLERAVEIDAGFRSDVLVQMIAMLGRYRDHDLSVAAVEPVDVRRFFAEWSAELSADSDERR